MKLKNKINLFIAFISLVLILFTIIYIYYDKKTHESLFIEKALAIANSFESSLTIEKLYNKQELLNLITKFKFTHNDLNSIDILDKEQYKIEKTIINIDGKSLKIIIPIEISGENKGSLKFDFSKRYINEIILKKRITLLALCISLSISLFLFMYLFSEKFIYLPLKELVVLVEKIKSNSIINKTKISDDEIGLLKKSIYEMYDELNESKKKLKEHQEELEKKVDEKTKELQNKIKDLEKFQKITIERELKMIELKNKIENLEKNKKTEKRKNE